MHDISNYISGLLFLHDCVIIPGFGGFVSNYKNSRQNELNNTFFPPSKDVLFNNNLTYNDGLLINYLSKNKNISYTDAAEQVKLNVQRAWVQLNNNGEVVFEGIGSFCYDKNKKLIFTPELTENFLTDSYGLSSFRFPPLNYQKQPKDIIPLNYDKKMHPGVKTTLKWAAVAIPLIGLLSLIPFYKNHNAQTAGISVNNNPDVVEPIEQTLTAFTNNNDIDIALSQNTNKRSALFYTEPVNTPVKKADIKAKTFYIIGGSFKDEAHAQILANEFKKKGFNAGVLQVNDLFRVTLCSFSDKVNALHELRRIRNTEQNDNVWIYSE